MPIDNGGTFTVGLIDVYTEMVNLKEVSRLGFADAALNYAKMEARVVSLERDFEELRTEKEELEDSKESFRKQVKLAILSSAILPILTAIVMLYIGIGG